MPTIMISISGGRTSAYMAHMMETNKDIVAQELGCHVDDLNYVYVFANTGMEHNDTLRFMNDVDQKMLGGKVVWVEGVAQHGKRVSTQHRITRFAEAYRNDGFEDERHPFHDHIIKYGISNQSYKNCSRELKRNTINSYMKSIGFDGTREDCFTAIGIREDEKRPVSKNAGARNIIYPLVDWFPTDKDEVIDWWKDKSQCVLV